MVEDEAIIALTIKNFLNRNDFNVTNIVVSAQEAIYEVESIKPDIIIMDIMLKGKIDGIQTAEYIWKNFQIPIIFLSSKQDIKTIERLRTIEHAGFLNKPFYENCLLLLIEKALEKNHARNVNIHK